MPNWFRLQRGLVGGVSLTIALVVAGCGIFGGTPTPRPTWHYILVLTVRNHTYRVTHHTLARVGRKVATVSYHGRYSGAYDVYSVPGVSVSKEVAVKARQGFLEAVRDSAASQ